MLLTITAEQTETLTDASDLGFLLHKHPERVQQFDVSSGTATVFYPEATAQRCSVALLLEVDPIGLIRGRSKNRAGFALGEYVNDRPYAATSLLAVALSKVFGTALNGRCDARPHLVDAPLALRIELPAVPGGADLIRRFFTPLGWSVETRPVALDPTFPEWGDSTYSTVALTGELTLAEALNHLYVLIPVLDNGKHYWVGTEEIEKLLRAGTGWLAHHPERELISHRYLAHQRDMVDEARHRLNELDDVSTIAFEEAAERTRPLVALRHDAVIAQVERVRPTSVLDLGCGQGALLRRLLPLQGVQRVVGTEVSDTSLAVATRRLHVDGMTERQADRLDLWLSSLQYQDDRLTGFDVAILMEVIEHIDLERLPAVVANVFSFMAPQTVIVTTPNREHNALYPNLSGGQHRHPDHRFEWTREQFASWCAQVSTRYGYRVEVFPVGDEDPQHGAPTQMAVFSHDDGVIS